MSQLREKFILVQQTQLFEKLTFQFIKYICLHMNGLYAQPDSIHLRQNWKSVVLTHPPHYPWLYPRVYNWKKLVQPMSVEIFQICDISGIFIFQSLIDSVLKTWAFVAAVIAVNLGACPVSSGLCRVTVTSSLSRTSLGSVLITKSLSVCY